MQNENFFLIMNQPQRLLKIKDIKINVSFSFFFFFLEEEEEDRDM